MSMDSAMAALAKAGQSQSLNTPNIVQDAPGRVGEPNPQVTPQAEPKLSLEDVLKPKEEISGKESKLESERFAALARKERGIVKQSQELKAREAKLSENMKKLEEFDSYKAQGKYLEALSLLGISYDDLTSFVLNGQRPSADLEIKAVKTEFEKYKKQQEDERIQVAKRQETDAQQANTKAIEDFKKETLEFLETNKGEYELINMHGASGIVLATVEQHYLNTEAKGKPEIMSLKQASDLVEEYLAKEVEKTINTAKRFKKPISSDDKGQAQESKGTTSSPTLSNALTSSSAPSLLSPKTEQDRLTRAMAALNKAS